jgi:hypothetical protein
LFNAEYYSSYVLLKVGVNKGVEERRGWRGELSEANRYPSPPPTKKLSPRVQM